jgi:hypothetical protein
LKFIFNGQQLFNRLGENTVQYDVNFLLQQLRASNNLIDGHEAWGEIFFGFWIFHESIEVWFLHFDV